MQAQEFKCQMCGDTFPVSDMDDHLDECPGLAEQEARNKQLAFKAIEVMGETRPSSHPLP